MAVTGILSTIALIAGSVSALLLDAPSPHAPAMRMAERGLTATTVSASGASSGSVATAVSDIHEDGESVIAREEAFADITQATVDLSNAIQSLRTRAGNPNARQAISDASSLLVSARTALANCGDNTCSIVSEAITEPKVASSRLSATALRAGVPAQFAAAAGSPDQIHQLRRDLLAQRRAVRQGQTLAPAVAARISAVENAGSTTAATQGINTNRSAIEAAIMAQP